MHGKINNPFTGTATLSVPVIHVINSAKKNTTTGEVEINEYFIEADSYVRVYTSPARRNYIFKLSHKARELYLLILYHLNPNKEYLTLSYNKINSFYRNEMGIEKDLYQRAFKETVQELVVHNIIDLRDRKKESYWLNPHFFFPGDRTKTYPDNMRVITRYDNRTDREKIEALFKSTLED